MLKQTHGTWTEREVSKALNLSSADTKQGVAAMQLQGYIEPVGRSQKWRTTDEGRTVSGAKSPRFRREAIAQARSTLSNRIRAINGDPNSAYAISKAVAFGDFLTDQARAQAADVGIRLVPKRTDAQPSLSVIEHNAEQGFLRQLRGKSTLLHIQAYEDWMSARSHRELL